MIEAGRHMPLPLPRPRGLEVAVNNHSKRNVVTVNYDEHRPAATSSVRPPSPRDCNKNAHRTPPRK